MFENRWNNQQSVQVLVVGAGPVGLCHAIWLNHQGAEVLVIDSRVGGYREHEWVIVSGDCRRLLERIGALDALRDSLVQYSGIRINDEASPSVQLSLGALGLPDAPLALLRRETLEAELERVATQRGINIARGQRLQRLAVSSQQCQATVEQLSKVSVGYGVSHTEAVVEKTRHLSALCVIGADGRRSVVRRDLNARTSSLGKPRLLSVAVLELGASPDERDKVRIQVGPDAIDTIWPLSERRVLWVAQLMDIRHPGISVERQIDLSVDPIQHGTVSDVYLQQGAKRIGLELERVVEAHAVRFQPTGTYPLGRGAVWLTGTAAQVVGPVLGIDDCVGLREVYDLALLLGFDQNGATGRPSLTPDSYERRRVALRERALGTAEPERVWQDLGWSQRQTELVLSQIPTLALPA